MFYVVYSNGVNAAQLPLIGIGQKIQAKLEVAQKVCPTRFM